jgi:hypothetical protein
MKETADYLAAASAGDVPFLETNNEVVLTVLLLLDQCNTNYS